MKQAIPWPLRLILGAAALTMIHPAPPVQWTATAIAALSVGRALALDGDKRAPARPGAHVNVACRARDGVDAALEIHLGNGVRSIFVTASGDRDAVTRGTGGAARLAAQALFGRVPVSMIYEALDALKKQGSGSTRPLRAGNSLRATAATSVGPIAIPLRAEP